MTSFHSFGLRDHADRDTVLNLWGRWGPTEVWTHPSVALSFAAAGDRPVCLTWASQAEAVLLPFTLRPPGGSGLLRQQRPVGHHHPLRPRGAFVVGAPGVRPDAFRHEVDAWAGRHAVISVFGHPLPFADQVLACGGSWSSGRPTSSVTSPWGRGGCGSTTSIRFARTCEADRASGVTVTVHQDLETFDEFMRVYQETMVRRGASDTYHYKRAFFEQLLVPKATRYASFHAWQDGAVISTKLVMASDRWSYSFLGGTVEGNFATRPNDLLKHEICLWSMAQGKTRYVLGGGYDNDDGIYRYKKAFAPHGDVGFPTGSRVYDQVGYAELVEQRIAWAAAQGESWEPRPGWFPAYCG